MTEGVARRWPLHHATLTLVQAVMQAGVVGKTGTGYGERALFAVVRQVYRRGINATGR